MEMFEAMVDKVRNMQKLRELQKLNSANNAEATHSQLPANNPRVTQDNIDPAVIQAAAAKRKNSQSMLRLGRYKFEVE